MHNPDYGDRFGNTPYKEMMPSVDAPAKDEPMLTSKEDMEAVAIFLASQGDEQGDEPRDAVKREKGERLFIQKCETCHLYKGEGDIEGSGSAPDMTRYGSIAWTRAQIAQPTSKETYREAAVDATGNKGHMPAFASEMSAADLDLLARWVRAKARNAKP
jgi:mono/diheme cytochrome c family protein